MSVCLYFVMKKNDDSFYEDNDEYDFVYIYEYLR